MNSSNYLFYILNVINNKFYSSEELLFYINLNTYLNTKLFESKMGLFTKYWICLSLFAIQNNGCG